MSREPITPAKDGRREPNTLANRPSNMHPAIVPLETALRTRNIVAQSRETFLDDTTPTESGPVMELGAPNIGRDSHDLSISQEQMSRDSLVDHMLLSLDQISYSQMPSAFPGQISSDEAQLYAAFGDEEPYSTYDISRGAGKAGHSYSYSLDYENASSQGRSRSSSQLTGGEKRAAGSASNYIPLLERKNSRRAPQLARPSSFDYPDRPPVAQDFQASPRKLSSQLSSYDYDAAPTPTVPAGPRRVRPLSPTAVSNSPAMPPSIERKRSIRSSKGLYKTRTAEGANGLGIDFGLDNIERDLPPLPAFIQEPAPAPLVSYGKKEELQHSSAHSMSKDKPGFFRRVFGSSKQNPAAAPERAASHGSTTSIENAADRVNRSAHGTYQTRLPTSQSRDLQAGAIHSHPQKDQPHVLMKKPSSFFRRRKKSLSENQAPPVPIVPPLSINSGHRETDSRGLPSPVSSLRKIMNPYLAANGRTDSPQTTSIEQRVASSDIEDDVRDFSPGYTPDRNATIRAVQGSSQDGFVPFREESIFSDVETSPVINRNISAMDSHDLDKGRSSSRASNFVVTDRARLVASPVPTAESVARDMALVAEYERVYSQKSPNPSKLSDSFADGSTRSPIESTSSLRKLSNSPPADEWVVVTPTKQNITTDRVIIQPTTSEEDLLRGSSLEVTTPRIVSQRSSGSTTTAYKSATSLPIVQVDGESLSEMVEETPTPQAELSLAATEASFAAQMHDDTEIDRDRARKIFDGDEEFLLPSKAAAWLGDQDDVHQRTLLAYMKLFDFKDINILTALRMLCAKLVLRAESQQVDRILDGFATRWCQCNPNHGFKVYDVVHTICYSLLLLNTDLHLADIESKMTRSQFVKNTIPTILHVIQDSAPEAFDRPTVLPGKFQSCETDQPLSKDDLVIKDGRGSVDADQPTMRGLSKASKRAESEGLDGQKPTPLVYNTPRDDCGPLVKAPFHGTLRTWEVQVEIVLKEFYNSIKEERLPLSAPAADKPMPTAPQTQSSLSVSGMLRRTPSVLSKAPSETRSYVRSRSGESRLGTAKWTVKNRSLARVYPNSVMGSSRTSVDDQSSLWSPSMSTSTWSKYSLGKTHTSMSTDSLGQTGDYQRSIGFASALSNVIVQEEVVGSAGSVLSGDSSDFPKSIPLLEDESLALYGAPWAKEGIVKHKHHLEATEKRAKDRNWTEVFAVVEKGYLTLFSFSSKSMKNKARGKAALAVVGGGNWQNNAEKLESFLLRQTIASALPPPGYSKARPHVWALTLSSGAVHLFQAGSPDIVKEYVSTANYWSARLSNHPLVGGISNIEYGWSAEIINNPLVSAISEKASTQHTRSASQSTVPISRPGTSQQRASLQSSLRSSLDHGAATFKSKLPGDKVTISEWSPPSQSMRQSNLLEQDQLKTLIAYVEGINEELKKHTMLRSPMLLAYTPRSSNAVKAMANWEKKSSYLLKEIVKYRTYIDTLKGAEEQKKIVCEEREERKAELERAAEAENDEDD